MNGDEISWNVFHEKRSNKLNIQLNLVNQLPHFGGKNGKSRRAKLARSSFLNFQLSMIKCVHCVSEPSIRQAQLSHRSHVLDRGIGDGKFMDRSYLSGSILFFMTDRTASR